MITKKQNQQFKKILKWVLKNPYSSFYRKKYKAIKDWQFSSLPFLTRQEIAEAQLRELLFVPETQIGSWNISSGTTADNFLMIPKMALPDPGMETYAKILNKLKIQKVMILARENLVLNRIRGAQFHPSLYRKRPFILGDIRNLNLSAKIAARLEVDGIETTSTILDFLLPFLKDIYDLNKIRFISLGGEYSTEQKITLFKSYFKNAYFHFRIGGTELPIFRGFRCEYISNMPSYFFHPSGFYIHEILDQEGSLVKDGERGELTLTTLKKCAFPLIRYKTGDAAVWHTTKLCKCGAKDLVEFSGRVGYDFIRVSGLTIHAEILEKVLLQIDPKLLDSYQLHIYEVIIHKKLLPKLVLHLTLPLSTSKQEKIKSKIESLFKLSPTMTLKELTKKGLILPLEIKLEDKKETSYKTVRIVSHLK